MGRLEARFLYLFLSCGQYRDWVGSGGARGENDITGTGHSKRQGQLLKRVWRWGAHRARKQGRKAAVVGRSLRSPVISWP